MKRPTRFKRFITDIVSHTPFIKMIMVLLILWLIFSAGIYHAERGVRGAAVESFGEALYWGIAAFSTAGIANSPETGLGKFMDHTEFMVLEI
jgi:voltage-gated potassium channel